MVADMSAMKGPKGASRYDQIHFAMIRIVHEDLYGLFVNPYGPLTEAGVKRAQRVLEVGCGPGFFTIPAAKIVGEAGYVYAVDINPAAVKHVNRKIIREGLKNVESSLRTLPKQAYRRKVLT